MQKVEYIDHMGNDLRVANAARVSFAKESQKFTLRKDVPKGSDEGIIEYLASHNHWTPFSHCMITMRETVPIFVARQRFKHMVGFTYNEVSRRYVDDTPEFFTPEKWRGRPIGGAKQGSSDIEIIDLPYDDHDIGDRVDIHERYENFIHSCGQMYQQMIAGGVAPEQARMVLPQSMLTSYYVTGSLYAWARAYNLRIHPHAQKEIRDLAVEWDKIIQPLFPYSWKALINGKTEQI